MFTAFAASGGISRLLGGCTFPSVVSRLHMAGWQVTERTVAVSVGDGRMWGRCDG